MKKLFFYSLILFIPIIISSCSGVNKTIENAQRLQFKLGKVDGLDIAGVNLSNIKSLNDVNIYREQIY